MFFNLDLLFWLHDSNIISTKDVSRGFPMIFLKIILLLFNDSCLHFLPTPLKLTSLPCFHPPPWFCPRVRYSTFYIRLLKIIAFSTP